MEQDKQQRTEPPSKRKLERARRKGDVAVSRHMAAAFATAAGLGGCYLAWMHCGSRLISLAKDCFAGGGIEAWAAALKLVAEFAGLAGGAAALAALFCLGLQTGLRLRLKIDLARLNPVKGLRRMFSKERAVDLLLVLGKVVLLATVGWLVGRRLLPRLFAGPGAGLGQSAAVGLGSISLLAACLAGAMLFSGVLDVFVTRRRHRRRLRMTKREVQDERKEEEGDPGIKAERRRLMRKASQGLGMQALPRAAVVVVNPTHLAVALGYKPEEDEAPWVLVSGRAGRAAAIRKSAARLGIPVVQNVPLARSLIGIEPGEEIPETLYEAVAGVIRAVSDLERGGGEAKTYLT